MRKKLLLLMIDDIDSERKKLIAENNMLKEKITDIKEKYEKDNSAAEFKARISELSSEIITYKAEIESLNKELEERDTVHNDELVKKDKIIENLRLENFDQKRIIDSQNNDENIKTVTSNDVAKTVTLKKPKIRNIPDITVDYKDAYEYASDVISKVIIEGASVKSKIAYSDSDIAEELLTLILGKTEMFKSIILQIALSDESIDIKKQKMDKEKAETFEYFEGVLGQLNNK